MRVKTGTTGDAGVAEYDSTRAATTLIRIAGKMAPTDSTVCLRVAGAADKIAPTAPRH
ncbi:hypothetical protein ACLB1E_19945 [Escherichia coli]